MSSKALFVLLALLLSVLPGEGADPVAEDQARLLYQQGLQAWHNRQYEEAARLCRRAMALDPDQAEAPNLLGAVLVQDRDFQGARKLYARSFKLKPNFNSAFNLAEMDFCEKKWRQMLQPLLL